MVCSSYIRAAAADVVWMDEMLVVCGCMDVWMCGWVCVTLHRSTASPHTDQNQTCGLLLESSCSLIGERDRQCCKSSIHSDLSLSYSLLCYVCPRRKRLSCWLGYTNQAIIARGAAGQLEEEDEKEKLRHEMVVGQKRTTCWLAD